MEGVEVLELQFALSQLDLLFSYFGDQVLLQHYHFGLILGRKPECFVLRA